MIMPMFPLGMVLLPGQLVPLHIFEQRYQQMFVRVRTSDPPIFGVVLIDRGSEVGGSDVRRSVGTCARLLREQELDEGCSAVIVGGTNRISVHQWLHDDPYPQADVRDFPDHIGSVDTMTIHNVHAHHRRVAALATEIGWGRFHATSCDDTDPILALYTMIAESALGPSDRQGLLEISDLSDRLSRFTTLILEQEDVLHMELRRSAD